MPAHGDFNVAYDITIGPHRNSTTWAGGAEVMVWLATRGHPYPLGRVVATHVQVSGSYYTVYMLPRPPRTDYWTVVTFVREKQTQSISNLNLGRVIRLGEQFGSIPSTMYLVKVQAGIEIIKGGQGFATKYFSYRRGGSPAANAQPRTVTGRQSGVALCRHGQEEEEEEIRLAPASSAAEWDQACAADPGATVVHSYEFLQSVAPPLRCRFVPLLVFHRGRPAGAAPLLVKRLGLFSTINWVPFPYLGPLVPEPLIPATLRALRAEARRRRALNHQQSFCRAIAGPGPGGFAAHAERTFVILLSGRSDEELLAAMHNGHRWQIRRARRAGIEVHPAQPGDFRLLDTWLDQMYSERGMRNGYPPGAALGVFQGLKASSYSFSQAARIGEQTVAVQLALADSRQALGWQIAVDPAFRAERPQALLVWRALQHARDLGIAEFDMVGAPNDGIATYKRRFGARERRYTVLQRQAGLHRMAHSAAGRLGWV